MRLLLSIQAMALKTLSDCVLVAGAQRYLLEQTLSRNKQTIGARKICTKWINIALVNEIKGENKDANFHIFNSILGHRLLPNLS